MKTYTEEEVEEATLEYFKGDDLATNVWMTKYALRNKEGKFVEKTPDDMHDRLAREFARIEKKYPNPVPYKKIKKAFEEWRILGQGSPMYGIGNPKPVSVANCFVVDLHDSYGSIMAADASLAAIYRRRGGCGLDLSPIRPKGLPVQNAAGSTTGIVPFMERFSNTTREVGQFSRRGALMETISIHHPEVESFISAKMDEKKITGANISVKLTDEFMNAVVNNEDYEQRWPVDSATPVVQQMVSAKKVWDLIIHCAWSRAEPGILFWDTILNNGPADIYDNHRSISTNPCSEISLSANDACRLMVLNTTKYVMDPFTNNSYFDYKKFKEDSILAQRLMDDLVDLELEKIDLILNKVESDLEPEYTKFIEKDLWKKIKEKAMLGRRTGLGVTGVGDTMAMLGLDYASSESIDEIEKIYKTLEIGAWLSSAILAEERGAFLDYDASIEKDHVFVQKILNADKNLQKKHEKFGRRNISLTTTAPCGSISLLTQTTSGIEPAFMLKYKRRRKVTNDDEFDFIDDMGDKWKEFLVNHHGFDEWMRVTGKTLVEESPFVVANDVDWAASVKLQGAAQQWVDHAISKTANIPNSATRELVSDVYMAAWKEGCKGFTVYRDGCRTGVLVSVDDKENEKFPTYSAPVRPEELPCEINYPTIKGEKWTIFVGMLDGRPYEVFGGLSNKIELPKKYEQGVLRKRPRKTKASIYDLIIGNGDSLVIKDIIEQFDNANYSTHTRLVSLALRHGSNVEYVVSQLQKDRDSDMFGFSRVLARVLKKYIPDGTTSTGEKACPSCKADSLIYQDGCVLCSNCGYSAC